jgi:hypothetical protein
MARQGVYEFEEADTAIEYEIPNPKGRHYILVRSRPAMFIELASNYFMYKFVPRLDQRYCL